LHHKTGRPLGAHEGSLQIEFGIGGLQECRLNHMRVLLTEMPTPPNLSCTVATNRPHPRAKQHQFNSQCLSADMLRPLGDLLSAIFVDVGDNEISAGPGKRFGNSGANAPASPGYDGQLTA